MPKKRSEQPNKKSLWSGEEHLTVTVEKCMKFLKKLFLLVWLIKPMTQDKGYEAGF